MRLLHVRLLLALGAQLLTLDAEALPQKRTDDAPPARIFKPLGANPFLKAVKPSAPSTYQTKVAGTGGDADTIKIESLGEHLPFELLAQDLLYGYEGATNQLVAAHGIETSPVVVKQGVFRQTSTFFVRQYSSPSREAFTLQQLIYLIDVLFEFGAFFNTRDIKFTYLLRGKARHLGGYLTVNGLHRLLKNTDTTANNSAVATTPTHLHHNATSLSARTVTDPFKTRAWDSLRLHPPATITFSHYGARIPFSDVALAVFGIYQWNWELITTAKTENFHVRLPGPLLELEGVKIDVKGEGAWLPLWAVRSVTANVFHFWLEGQGGGRECSFEYENEEGRRIWGYVTRGAARPLPPGGEGRRVD